MGLGTDAVAGLGVAAYGEPSRGSRQLPDKAVVSCLVVRRPLFVDGRRGNGLNATVSW